MKKRPAFKTARRLGAPIYEKTQTQKYAAWEQSKPRARGRGPRTDFAKQMLEKQKARLMYGITEKQFRGYVEKAMKGEKPGQQLFALLESRLDNIVYRCGIAPTRRAARQMVSHGHFTVNGKKTTVPSHHLSKDDSFVVREGSKQKKHINEQEQHQTAPAWITYEHDKKIGTISGTPSTASHELLFDLDAIIEFYNR
jgi:small subunit ribosomal protein S4